MEKKSKAANLSGLFLLVVAAALVAVNVVGYNWNKRIDMTKNERFTLSKGSANLVSQGLKEKMKVTFYATRGLPALELFVEDLTYLLGEYEGASNGQFEYVVVEPKTEEEKKAAKEAGLQEVPFGQSGQQGDAVNLTQGFLGLVFEYGSEKDTIPVLSPGQTRGLEFWISSKIRELRDKVEGTEQHVGVIVRDGMKLSDSNLVPPQGGRPGPNLKGIIQNALPFYKIDDVDLADGATEIDPELRGVIVLQADKDWTLKELARIDEFLMRGDRSLLVVAGAVNMKASDATMVAELNTRGLEKLLGPYGIEMKKEAIVDWGTQMRLQVRTQMGRPAWMTMPGVLQLQHKAGAEDDEQILDSSFTGFFRIEELAFPYPSTLVPHAEAQPAANLSVVARSTESATVMTDDRVDLKPRTDFAPSGDKASRVIAINVEGKIKSAFADKPVEGITAPKESASESRILVISSPQFLCNPFARAGNPPPMPPQMAMMGAMGGDKTLQAYAGAYAQSQYLTNMVLGFKNLMDWMANDKDLIATSAKLLDDPNITYGAVPEPDVGPDDSEESIKQKLDDYKQGRRNLQNKVQWTLILLPSLLFAAFGVLWWRRRESMRDAQWKPSKG